MLVKAEELEKPKDTEKVKTTKVFDFAGEEVRVAKEVDATFKEAKSFFKQNEKKKQKTKKKNKPRLMSLQLCRHFLPGQG